MERKFLEELGLEKEAIDKILDVNSGDIGAAKKGLTDKLEATEGERDGLKTQLQSATDSLKSFEGIDPADLQQKLDAAQTALGEAEKAHTTDLAKRDSRTATEKFLASHKFINDITRDHYVGAIEDALEDAANRGKSREDIFSAFTQEDGKPKAGIFLEENPNQMPNMPPAGGGAPPTDDFSFSFTPINR